MAAKAANVIDRKESNIKEQAEEIMDMHGIPVSLSGSGAPAARDELDDAAFYAMMEHGLKEAISTLIPLKKNLFPCQSRAVGSSSPMASAIRDRYIP